MSFFNKKEEVIDLQLTQYGKQLLSKGIFKPIYYSFFDSNVIYDSSYSGITNEVITSIEQRIQDETPYNKTQYVFSSRETAMNSFINTNRARLANEQDIGALSFDNPAEQAYTQILPLGNSEKRNQKSPHFSVLFLNGELSGTVVPTYSSSYSVQKIPQLNATINYKIKPIYTKEITPVNEKTRYEYVFSDNSVFKITSDHILLQILEKNVEFEKENFEIIPYLIEEISGSSVANAISSSYEQLINLPFEKTFVETLAPTNVTLSDQSMSEQFIGHFFEILVDDEIPEEMICSSISRLKKLDYQLDDDYDCEERPQLQTVNIYQSNITGDDIEQCEI